MCEALPHGLGCYEGVTRSARLRANSYHTRLKLLQFDLRKFSIRNWCADPVPGRRTVSPSQLKAVGRTLQNCSPANESRIAGAHRASVYELQVLEDLPHDNRTEADRPVIVGVQQVAGISILDQEILTSNSLRVMQQQDLVTKLDGGKSPCCRSERVEIHRQRMHQAVLHFPESVEVRRKVGSFAHDAVWTRIDIRTYAV